MQTRGDLQPPGPKRLQKGGSPEQAMHEYARLYREAVSEGDRFMSEMYMDELLTSIILVSKRDKPSRGLPKLDLERKVHHVMEQLPLEQEECMEENLEIALSKRYPKLYRVDESYELGR